MKMNERGSTQKKLSIVEKMSKGARRRETTSTSKHTAWIYLSSFSVEAYAKGVDIITTKNNKPSVCMQRENVNRQCWSMGWKKSRKNIWRPTLKIYMKFFFSLSGWHLGDCLTHSPTFYEQVPVQIHPNVSWSTNTCAEKWGKWSCVQLDHPRHFHSLAFRSVLNAFGFWLCKDTSRVRTRTIYRRKCCCCFSLRT